jgi:CHAT domain-containing protein
VVPFFDNLASGQGKADALRNAQLWMLREGLKHPNDEAGPTKLGEEPARGLAAGSLPPQYWAAFTLTGPPRQAV